MSASYQEDFEANACGICGAAPGVLCPHDDSAILRLRSQSKLFPKVPDQTPQGPPSEESRMPGLAAEVMEMSKTELEDEVMTLRAQVHVLQSWVARAKSLGYA